MTIRSFWITGVAATQLLACAVDGENVATTADAPDWETFKAGTYREPWAGGAYIVDGDTPIHGDDALRAFYDRLYGADGALIINLNDETEDRWQPGEQNRITYCVGNSFASRKAEVVAALEVATAEWEWAAQVDFVYVPAEDAACTAQNGNVVFDVNRVVGQPYDARAFFPSFRRSQRNLLIDDVALTDPVLPLVGILRHELGHALGFRHEHIRPEAQGLLCPSEADDWGVVTPYDSASVMHYQFCRGGGGGNPGLVLSELDQQGVAAVYGARTRIAALADYDGDRKADIAEKGDNGVWRIDYARDGFGRWNESVPGFGGTPYHAVPADYDGDGKADLAVKDDILGEWYVDYARDGFGGYNPSYPGFGGASYHAVPADYDGDGKADLAVKDDIHGEWYIDYAGDGFGGYNPSYPGFGGASYHAVPADYDGDGKADLALKGDVHGDWYIDYARDGFGGYNPSYPGFGGASYHAVPADYDGDGKADLALKGDIHGDWYTDYAGDGFGGYNPSQPGWGGAGFIALTADFDGDGKADRVVRKADNGSYHVDRSANGFAGVDLVVAAPRL